MTTRSNPFNSDAANKLDDDLIIDYYIDDHNYSRLLQSKRNVFLVGERGSGKSMTLIYNTAGIQRLKAQRDGVDPSLEFVGVLVPCNTPLTHKNEFQLLEEFRASIVSEYFFALSIAFEIVNTLAKIPDVLDGVDEAMLREEFEYVTDIRLLENRPFFESLMQAFRREIALTQRQMNQAGNELFYDKSLSFATLIVPLLHLVRRIPRLVNSHFLLMLDDAHELNQHQVRSLNSWIAYRDRSNFSFKVAAAKVGQPGKATATGGTILEGHDYSMIDMEEPFHNEESDFGQLATKIVQRRLDRAGIQQTPEEFFPIDPRLKQGLEEAAERVRERATELFPNAGRDAISDYVQKQRRPEYFRSRSSKANRPSYSGFSTLVYISTGVVRNLLEPCARMYDATLSALPQEQRTTGIVSVIEPRKQTEIVLERSSNTWKILEDFDKRVEGCTRIDAERIYHLFDKLAIYFQHRLLHHRSEPGAISFSISQRSHPAMKELEPLLAIAQRAQMLYVRQGTAKSDGARESYYVPNRILWPIRGLDPHGQHARVSIKSSVLLQAAYGKRIPVSDDKELQSENVVQQELFDE